MVVGLGLGLSSFRHKANKRNGSPHFPPFGGRKVVRFHPLLRRRWGQIYKALYM